jgi:hypothetical protein
MTRRLTFAAPLIALGLVAYSPQFAWADTILT